MSRSVLFSKVTDKSSVILSVRRWLFWLKAHKWFSRSLYRCLGLLGNISFTQPVTMYPILWHNRPRRQGTLWQMQHFRISNITMIYRVNIEFFTLVDQTLSYSSSNNTNNIRFKLWKNSFNAVWKKAAPPYVWGLNEVSMAVVLAGVIRQLILQNSML